MVKQRIFEAALGMASFLLCGCDSAPQKVETTPPAKVDNPVKESGLTRVTLTPEAENRLGIELARVVEQIASNQIRILGDVLAIPGKALMVGAPASGTVVLANPRIMAGQAVRSGQPVFRLTPMLAPQRDLKTTYEADLQSAKSRLDTAKKQLDRATQLLQDMAGSRRNVELADQEFGQSKAGYDAAQVRLNRLETHPLDADVDMTITAPSDGILRQILAAQGQNVTAGGTLFEVVDLRTVWLRVPVYAGDLKAIGSASTITIRDVDGTGPILEGRRVDAPPTADPLSVTSDLYYEIANPNLQLRPGQRLSATLPLRTSGRLGLSVPLSAILYDVHGGTWLYVNEAPHVYRRQRVELAETDGATAFLLRGLTPGLQVVAQGATELFGTEFGAGH